MATAPKNQATDDQDDQTSPAQDNDYIPEGDLVVPNEVADSGHGGSAPAPLPHPLTEEANKPAKPGEVSETPEKE